MRRVLASLSILAILPFTSGCVAAGVAGVGAVGTAVVQEKSLGMALDDATSSSEIKTKLIRADRKKFGEVDVEVANGLVLLSGRVNSQEDKIYAERVAWSSSRILDVANELKIEGPNSFMEGLSDSVITTRVRSALVGSKTVRSVNFNIETYDGVVYLMGIARSQKELEHAAEKASYIPGVKEVVSYVQLTNNTLAGPPAPIGSSYQSLAPQDRAALPAQPEPLRPSGPRPIGSPAYDTATAGGSAAGELSGGGIY